MLKKRLIVNINFNNYDMTDKRLEEDWIRNRIKIFNEYTLRSLKKQTCQDFLCHILYDNQSEECVSSILAEHEKLPHNIKFISVRDNEKDKANYIKDSDVLLLVRIDSDDMFHQTYLERLNVFPYKEDTQAVVPQKGYVYYIEKGEIYYDYQESPPCYTLIYDVQEYLSGYRHKFGPGGHTKVVRDLRYEVIYGYNYMHTNHDYNVSDLEYWKRITDGRKKYSGEITSKLDEFC